MHVEAERAAVDLRHAIVDEVDQLPWKTGLLDRLAERQHGLEGVRISFAVVEARLHRTLPCSSLRRGGRLHKPHPAAVTGR
jgi:hypothetical protein